LLTTSDNDHDSDILSIFKNRLLPSLWNTNGSGDVISFPPCFFSDLVIFYKRHRKQYLQYWGNAYTHTHGERGGGRDTKLKNSQIGVPKPLTKIIKNQRSRFWQWRIRTAGIYESGEKMYSSFEIRIHASIDKTERTHAHPPGKPQDVVALFVLTWPSQNFVILMATEFGRWGYFINY